MIEVAKLKRLEQEGKTIEEFVQKFKRAVKNIRYEERLLVEEFIIEDEKLWAKEEEQSTRTIRIQGTIEMEKRT